MDPDSRIDLFLSFHGSEKLSTGFTTRELASATRTQVLERSKNLGTAPSIFFESREQQSERVDALLQTRPGGLALFLLTPTYFEQPCCIAELRAFLQVRSSCEFKLRFICLNSTADDILSIALLKGLEPALSNFVLRADISVRSIQETSADLSDVVFSAWEGSDVIVSPNELPTILGHTRHETFLVLQRVFTEDDIPTFRAVLSWPKNVTNVLDLFGVASDRGLVTQYNVEKLHEVLRHRSSPSITAQSRKIKAYERKWVGSARLDWGEELRENLLRLYEKNEGVATQASSSKQPQKRSRETEVDDQEISAFDAKRPRKPDNIFKPYFFEPLQPGNVVIDFKSRDDNGNPLTAEGRLLRKVLELSNSKDGRGVSASGMRRGAAHGMGGVGKTTALRALCYEDQVRNAFTDGIWFLEFGEDADDRKVINEVAQCVRGSGGGTAAQEMNEASSLSEVLEKGAAWLHSKTVLLVCDDLWGKKNKFGYLPDLTKLLQHAPRSKLVISTRDQNIADSAGESVEFSPLDAEGVKARAILLADVPAVEKRAIVFDKPAEEGIRRILKLCAGLPLALAIAGRGLRKSVRYSSTISEDVLRYCELLEQNSKRITIAKLEHYPGLNKVIDSSLKQCQEWGTSDEVDELHGRTFDMISMFKGLCVLKKHMSLPKRVLRLVWDMDDTCTNEVIEKFSDFNLASRVDTGLSTQHESGLRLHDLVLERCQQMAGHESSRWHKRIVDAYGKKHGFKNDDEDEVAEKSRPWWDADDDGYVFAHLSRHLALSDQSGELEYLLCDIRWTMRRLKFSEWSSLNVDFERLFSVAKHAENGMRKVRDVLKDSWPYARDRRNLIAFYVFAHLSRKEREDKYMGRLLSSIDHHFPKPWLRPATRCITVTDRREVWKDIFTDGVKDIIVDWTSENVFAASDEYIFSWSTNEQRMRWKHPYQANAIALSQGGNVIVSGSSDKTIRRWDAHTGALIGDALVGHASAVMCVAASSDGNVIVSGSADKTIQRWDAHTGAPIGDALHGHQGSVRCVAISSDGKVIVSGSADWTIRRWDANSGAPIGDALRGHANAVYCVAVTSDGNVIVSGSADETIQRWDAHTGALIGDALAGHASAVMCVATSSDGNVIVSGSWDNTIRRWDANSGAPIGDALRGHASYVTCVAVNCDGNVILSGSSDKTIRRWDAHSGALIGDALHGHASYVTCVAVSSDGNVIVSGSSDWTIRRWDAHSGAPIGDALRGHQGSVRCVAISSDGNVIVSASWDKTIRRWNAHTGAPIGNALRGHARTVHCVAVSSDGNVIVSGAHDNTILRWDANSGASSGDALRGHASYVTCVAVSNDDSVIVSGSADGTIRRWNARSGTPIGDALRGHASYVTCVALSSDGNVIVSASGDKTIRRWDAHSGAPIGDAVRGHASDVGCAPVSSEGNTIVSGFWDMIKWLRGGSTILSADDSVSQRASSIVFEAPEFSAICLVMDLRMQQVVFGFSNGSIVICRLVE